MSIRLRKRNKIMKTKKELTASAGRMPPLVVHLLKYGGCWIVAIMVYAILLWLVPWQLWGTPWAVLLTHAGIVLFVWFLYGVGAFDGDP